MGQIYEGGQAKKPEGIFDSLLNDLDRAVSQTATDAETYNKYMNKIDSLVLKSDLKKQESILSDLSPVEIPDNVIYKLRILVGRLKDINAKNAEILSYFDTLV